MYVHIKKKKTYCYEKEENTITQFKNYIHDGILSIKKKGKKTLLTILQKAVYFTTIQGRKCVLS